MNLRPMLIVNGLFVAGMAAISAWAWQTIPEGAAIPARFDLEGNPSGTLSKTEFLVIFPTVGLALTLLFWLLPRLDPRRENIEASAKFWNVAAILSIALLAYTQGLLVLFAAGHKIDTISALVPAISLLFIGLGNYLGKTRSNWFGGVRTPWTMSSEYAWDKTHQWSGRMMVAAGIAGLVAWFALDAKLALMALIGLVLATAVISVVLSYVFWKADPNRQTNGTAQ